MARLMEKSNSYGEEYPMKRGDSLFSYAKLINGQGLAKLMNDTNLQVVGINTIEDGEIKKLTRT